MEFEVTDMPWVADDEADFYCYETVDYDNLSEVSVDVSPLSDESSQDSSGSQDDQAMEWMEHLLTEEVQSTRQAADLARALAECHARQTQLRELQRQCLQVLPRDDCLARYGLLWSSDTFCPQCGNSLPYCTTCETHQHIASTGHVYVSFGPLDSDQCLLCRVDQSIIPQGWDLFSSPPSEPDYLA